MRRLAYRLGRAIDRRHGTRLGTELLERETAVWGAPLATRAMVSLTWSIKGMFGLPLWLFFFLLATVASALVVIGFSFLSVFPLAPLLCIWFAHACWWYRITLSAATISPRPAEVLRFLERRPKALVRHIDTIPVSKLFELTGPRYVAWSFHEEILDVLEARLAAETPETLETYETFKEGFAGTFGELLSVSRDI